MIAKSNKITTNIKQNKPKNTQTINYNLDNSKKTQSGISPNTSFFQKDQKQQTQAYINHSESLKDLSLSNNNKRKSQFHQQHEIQLSKTAQSSFRLTQAKKNNTQNKNETHLKLQEYSPIQKLKKSKKSQLIKQSITGKKDSITFIKKQDLGSKAKLSKQYNSPNKIKSNIQNKDRMHFAFTKLEQICIFPLRMIKESIGKGQECELKQQIQRLNLQNKQLQIKLNKFKALNQQNKKQLRDQILNFNLQGEQTKKNKQNLVNLEKQVEILQSQNVNLQALIQNLKNRVQQLEKLISTANQDISNLLSQNRNLVDQNQLIKDQCQKNTQKYQRQMLALVQKQNAFEQVKNIIPECNQILPLQSNFKSLQVSFEEVTDLSLNSYIKQDGLNKNESKIPILDRNQIDIISIIKEEFAMNLKQVEESYHKLVDQLKEKILQMENENYDLYQQIQRKSSNNDQRSYLQMNIDTDRRILELLNQNSQLKFNLLQSKEVAKKLQQQNLLMSLNLMQSKKTQQINILKSQIFKNNLMQHQLIQLTILRKEHDEIKSKLNESQKCISSLQQNKRANNELISKLSSSPKVMKKSQYFK